MKTLSLARQAVRAFPRSEWADRKTVNGNRRRWINARKILGKTLLEGRAFQLKPFVLATYDRYKDAAVLAVTVAGGLPILVHDIALRVMS